MTKDQTRVVIQNIHPSLDGGSFAVKAVVGETLAVTADILSDGHDVLAASVLYKHERERRWKEQRMVAGENDSWSATISVEKQGNYQYKVQAWVDYALTWQHGTERKIDDGQHVNSELLEGAEYLEKIKSVASAKDKSWLIQTIASFRNEDTYDAAVADVTSDRLTNLLMAHPEKFLLAESKSFPVYVDRLRARFSTWYEFFPRSAAKEPGTHGTFADCEALLPRVANMGFDILYFPPVHPIGEVNRKGKNNATDSEPGDVGSPWGIGSKHGGHTDIHPDLGTLDDFKRLVQKASDLGVEVAMDFALQAAPDHPWVKDHPEWFKWRPDGTVQYAENPPKKYQDILPIYFESSDWKNLWAEMLNAALFWVEECGIRVFRVDNPHTKPFLFWGWLIGEVKKKHPDVLFLSEAFTRPKIMHQLALQGFTQSYTYFTWRNSRQELIDYVTELTTTDQRYFFRPNFWPNTPDINPWHLQGGNESIHLQRYFLAATLSSNTGLYGPVYEYMDSAAVPGKEEYLNSEKYEVRHWDWTLENKLTRIISRINAIRKEEASLQQTNNIQFLNTENEQLLAYYKYDDARTSLTLMVVSLDPHYTQKGLVELPLAELGVHEGHQVRVHDLITDSSYLWDKAWNYVELHPALPFHLFRITL